LADGTIDAIATDHAPHAPAMKAKPFTEAPPGMLGLETVLAVAHTELVETGVMTMAEMLATLTWKPAHIAALESQGRPVTPGAPANLCVFDPALRWEVDPDQLASKAANTPYIGRKLSGRVRHTIWNGTPTVMNGSLTE
jgi:dihydroorotase